MQPEQRVEVAFARYTDAYRRLYARSPGELEYLGGDWVLVNDARMHVRDLEALIEQLNQEYRGQLDKSRRSVVRRLLAWFSKP